MSITIPSLDLTHPFASGIGGAGFGPASIYPFRGVIAASGGFRDTRHGRGVLCDGAVGISLCAFPAQTDTTNFTMMLVAESPDALANIGIGYRNGGGPGTSFAKLMPSNGAAAIPKLDYYNNGVARSISGGSYSGSNVIFGVKRGLNLDLYVNGNLESTAAYTTGQLSANAATCYYGPDETVTHTVALVFGAFWPNRNLAANEIASLSAKPLQMLKEYQ